MFRTKNRVTVRFNDADYARFQTLRIGPGLRFTWTEGIHYALDFCYHAQMERGLIAPPINKPTPQSAPLYFRPAKKPRKAAVAKPPAAKDSKRKNAKGVGR